jgi:hypothetical protein
LFFGPILQAILAIIAFIAEHIGDGNPFGTGEAIATVPAESFSSLGSQGHELLDFFWGQFPWLLSDPEIFLQFIHGHHAGNRTVDLRIGKNVSEGNLGGGLAMEKGFVPSPGRDIAKATPGQGLHGDQPDSP